MTILEKIEKAGLVGRGGACFPTATKWSAVAKAMADKTDGKKKAYVVCNASEGEPGVKKDGYILKKHADKVIDGMMVAINFLEAEKGIIFLNHKYFRQLATKLNKEIKGKPIEIFIKPVGSGYVAGEESSLLNAIEGKRIEPRLRPPFPTTNGLFDQPTLVNNVETFYNVSLVNSNEFQNKRFYNINGDCLWTKVFELPDNYTIEKVLKETDNYPDFPFFVQVGGDGSGEVFNDKQLKRPVTGAGTITVHSLAKHKPKELLRYWLEFFVGESCGKCTPCREGIYRLLKILNSPEPDWNLFKDLLDNLSNSAICGLGCALPIPINSYVKNVLKNISNSGIKIKDVDTKMICECFR